MSTKLPQKMYPDGHSPNDFQCFGPPATKDGVFEGTMIADLGCFKQDMVDSNKYYHGAVVQSKKNSEWYAYFEWGRQGAPNPSFQFIKCGSKSEAELEYADQLHSKNDKRGQWENHSALGTVLRPKPGKDCYLVRPQATRSTGLPDARTITSNDGAKQPVKVVKKTTLKIDQQTLALMRDLNVGTVNYTRSEMSDAAIPTQAALDEAREILRVATQRVGVIGDDINVQHNDKELLQLTYDLYGRIPKKKDRGAAVDSWILSQNNIQRWGQDIDAFESALYAVDMGEQDVNPFGDMPISMNWVSPNSEHGQFIYDWMPSASRNKHSYLGHMRIKNVWYVENSNELGRFEKTQKSIAADRWSPTEVPLHQPKKRIDLNPDALKLAIRSGTYLMFHGTRSVNVSGILRESLRLPKQLVGVAINGAMFGPGLYWADDWKKSAGYTSLDNSYYSAGSGAIRGRSAFMFVAEVALGKAHVAEEAYGFTSPPSGCHCVMGKHGRTKSWGGKLLNNEFIVYTTAAHRLRWLVEFAA